MLTRSIDLLMAMASLCAGGFLAFNHPLGSLIPMGLFVLFALSVFARPSVFLIAIPALLPVMGFAPWSGWITFEELDLLVLAASAGGYARQALDRTPASTQRPSLLLIVLSILMSASIAISMFHGFADAGGFAFGWFQGYDGPMNSVRIGKSFFLALLLVPLTLKIQKAPEANASRQLAIGMAIGLGTASLAALWERLVFTGLLNFSSDYRTTALFWEMHVGGAALDGWLLLAFPFAIWALRHSRNTAQTMIAFGLAGLAAYAALTTFSRGVYLALVVSLPLLAWQTQSRSRPGRHDEESRRVWGLPHWTLAIILLGAMAGLVFSGGGYRGLLALTGVIALTLSMPLILRGQSLTCLLLGVVAGVLSGSLFVVVSNFLNKGPYVLYGVLFALTCLAVYWPGMRSIKSHRLIGLISFVCLTLSAVNVTGHWGGVEALPGAFGAFFILALILVFGMLSRQPLWPTDLRWQGRLLAIVAAISAVIAVFGGGAYIANRFSTAGSDFDGRIAHWKHALTMLPTTGDLVFGKGLGRYPANFYLSTLNGAHTGTSRINVENGNSSLFLSGANKPMSPGDILRISQRLPIDSQGPFEADFRVNAKTDVKVYLEVCEKQLLYPAACAVGQVAVKASNDGWKTARIRLEGPLLGQSPWLAPAFKVFSLGIANQRGTAEIDDLVLSSPGGANLLKNGTFAGEMKHWFTTSDRDHLPWHAKNLLVNLLFDQGIAGMTIFLLMIVSVLWRLRPGNAQGKELAPYLTAAVIGFLIVGVFDSLTDVPRLAFMVYFLILHGLSYGSATKQRRPDSRTNRQALSARSQGQ